MITQCEIRKLYEKKNEPGIRDAIELAKNYERRRCGHHPDEYPQPLSTLECLSSVVDPKQSGQNKHRYVVASQNLEVRQALRRVRAVPLIYINRSVMILEPMATDSADVRLREEKAKFRAELKKMGGGKRKREEEDDEDDIDKEEGGVRIENGGDLTEAGKKAKRSRAGGLKSPNPLSVMKSKKKILREEEEKARKKRQAVAESADKPKNKRRRRAKSSATGERADGGAGEAGNANNAGDDK